MPKQVTVTCDSKNCFIFHSICNTLTYLTQYLEVLLELYIVSNGEKKVNPRVTLAYGQLYIHS